MRKLKETTVGKHMVRLYYNRIWQEYVIKLYIDGKHYEPADAF